MNLLDESLIITLAVDCVSSTAGSSEISDTVNDSVSSSTLSLEMRMVVHIGEGALPKVTARELIAV